MSEFEIDKLFRRKLVDKKVEPSNEAWEKLSAELKKTNSGKKWTYWSVAASVALILGMGVYLLNDDKVDNSLPIAENNDLIDRSESVSKNPLVEERSGLNEEHFQGGNQSTEKVEAAEENIAVYSEQKKVSSKKDDSKIKETTIVARVEEKALKDNRANTGQVELVERENFENVEIEEVSSESLDDDLPLMAADLPDSYKIESEEFPEIKIIYKSSEKAREDKNALRKVVALARDIKEADIGLGTLREAKNELLAFGLKKTKDN